MSYQNTVSQEELATVRKTVYSDQEIAEVKELMDEQGFELAANGMGSICPAVIEETGEKVSALEYQLCYNLRVDRLFAKRDAQR